MFIQINSFCQTETFSFEKASIQETFEFVDNDDVDDEEEEDVDVDVDEEEYVDVDDDGEYVDEELFPRVLGSLEDGCGKGNRKTTSTSLSKEFKLELNEAVAKEVLVVLLLLLLLLLLLFEVVELILEFC